MADRDTIKLGKVTIERSYEGEGSGRYTWYLNDPGALVTERELVFMEELCWMATAGLLAEGVRVGAVLEDPRGAYERYHNDHAPFVLAGEPVKGSWASSNPGVQNVAKASVPGGIPHQVVPSSEEPDSAVSVPGCAGETSDPSAKDDPLPVNPDCPETLEHCPGRMECQQRTLPGRPLLEVLRDEDLGERFLNEAGVQTVPEQPRKETWRDRPPML